MNRCMQINLRYCFFEGCVRRFRSLFTQLLYIKFLRRRNKDEIFTSTKSFRAARKSDKSFMVSRRFSSKNIMLIWLRQNHILNKRLVCIVCCYINGYLKQCGQTGSGGGTPSRRAVINCTPPRTPGKSQPFRLVLITTPRFSDAPPLVG